MAGYLSKVSEQRPDDIRAFFMGSYEEAIRHVFLFANWHGTKFAEYVEVHDDGSRDFYTILEEGNDS